MQVATAYVDWAKKHPAYHQVLRKPGVIRHADDDLKPLLGKFAAVQKEEVIAAQNRSSVATPILTRCFSTSYH